MKKFLLVFGFFGFIFQLTAQVNNAPCTPDAAFADADRVVSPLPLDLETGEGGIEMMPACIGEPYELVFTFKIGDSATIAGFSADLIQAQIATEGAVEGLPEGVNYSCFPIDCIFPDTVLGCIVLSGTPTENNEPGINKLVITAEVIVNGFPAPIRETIPGDIFSGEYNLVVNANGECSSVSVNDYLAENISLGSMPNPVIDHTTIEVSSDISGDFQFHVFDVAGKLMHTEAIQLANGYNAFPYDATALGDGMYIYSISNGAGAISEKLIVNRR